MDKLPQKAELAAAILEVLREKNSMKTADINAAVIEILGIPEDLLKIEDANCTGSEFSYRTRRARTDLKQKGKIKSPGRGI